MVMKILLLEAGWRQGCAVGRPSRELQFLQDLSSAPSPSRQPPPRAGKHSVWGRQSLVLALRWGCPVTLCSFTSAWKTRGLPPDSRGARKAASVAWLSSMELLVDPVSGRAEHCLGVKWRAGTSVVCGKPKGSGTIQPSKPVLLLLSLYGSVSESEWAKLRRQIDLCAKLLRNSSGPIASSWLFRLTACSPATVGQEKEVKCPGAQQDKSIPFPASGLIPKTWPNGCTGLPLKFWVRIRQQREQVSAWHKIQPPRSTWKFSHKREPADTLHSRARPGIPLAY